MVGPRDAWRAAWANGIPQRALVVALVVGTVLNLINQGDAALSGCAINWGKLVLTYAVPFAVSTHGALSVKKR